MDIAAVAETTVDLWVECKKAYKKRVGDEIDRDAFNVIFERASALYITNLIGSGRGDVPPKQTGSTGGNATGAQLSYIKDLGGDPNKVRTKRDASDYIEELCSG